MSEVKIVLIKNEQLDTHQLRLKILSVVQTKVKGILEVRRLLIEAYPDECSHIECTSLKNHILALSRAGLLKAEKLGNTASYSAVPDVRYVSADQDLVPDEKSYGLGGIYRMKDRPARLDSRPLARNVPRLYSGISTLTVNV